MECEHCGTSYEEGDNFCSMCGRKIGNDANIVELRMRKMRDIANTAVILY